MNDTIKALTETVRGRVIPASDPDCDDARAVYNAMRDRTPHAVVQRTESADVMAVIATARDSGVDLAIRGGGHSVPGFGAMDDGLVIDLSPMNGVRVDPAKKVARVAGGATLGDVDHVTHPFGLAAPGGVVSTTGVAGLTLGGGIGYPTRGVGLSIDDLLSADVVLADDRQVTASDHQNEDLFWALRGGGNFGVVTSFEFRLHEVGDVEGGPLFYEFDDATAVLECNRSYINAPPLPFIPEGRVGDLFCVLVTCRNGPHEEAERVLRPLRDVAEVKADQVDVMSFPPLQSYYAAIHPHSGSDGGYIDFMSGHDGHRAAENYGARYERLSAVKAVYDPDNLFHVNQNIAPAKWRCAR